jgi:hypothetical protein
MEEIEEERKRKLTPARRDPEVVRMLESLRLARTELERQRAHTSHDRRRTQLAEAIAEIDRRIAAIGAAGQPSAAP